MFTKMIQKYATYLRRPSVVILIAASLASFTPYYTIGILVIISILAVIFPVSATGFFRSVLSRLITAFLAFEAWVMLVAMYGWLGKLELHPAVYIFSFLVLYLVVHRSTSTFMTRRIFATKEESGLTSSKKTLLSAGLAGVGLLIMGLSFYAPHPSLASTVQIITNGYDNSAHLSLIRTTSEAGGYVYGSYDVIGDKVAWKTLTAYPQGWHFANAFIWNGLGGNPFAPDDMSLALSLYVGTLFAWYFMAVFIFNQLLLYALSKNKPLLSLGATNTLLFSALSILIQMLVFWGALVYGFGTFLCALVYLFLLAVIVIHYQHLNKKTRGHQWAVLVLASLGCAMAVAQGWLFATPIVAVIMLLSFIPREVNLFRFLPMLRTRHGLTTIALGLLIALPIVIQGWINVQFSTQGTSQINDDGGIFGISTHLALVIIVLALVALISTKNNLTGAMRNAGSVIVLPALGFSSLLLLYQLSTLGHPAYFFTKSLAIALCLAWLPLACMVFAMFERAQKQLEPLYIMGVIIVAFLAIPLMLGQDTTSFRRLLQRQSNITTPFAEKLADSARSGELKHKKVFLVANERYDGDVIGSIFTLTAARNRDQCTSDALWVIITRRLNEFSHYANLCSPQGSLEVITGKNTPSSLTQRLEPEIEIVR